MDRIYLNPNGTTGWVVVGIFVLLFIGMVWYLCSGRYDGHKTNSTPKTPKKPTSTNNAPSTSITINQNTTSDK